MTRTAFVATAFELDRHQLAASEQDGPPILVTALALPWGATVPLNWWGDTVAFDRGSVEIPDDPGRIPFLRDHLAHDSAHLGRLVGLDDRADGLHAAAAIPRAELAEPSTARIVRHIAEGIRNGVSVSVEWDDANATRTPIPGDRFAEHHQVHAGARLFELSSVVLPRFDDARVTGLAASADPDELDPDDEPDDDPDELDEPDDTTTEEAMPTLSDTTDADRLAAHRETLASATRPATPAGPARDRRGLGQFAYELLRDRTGAPAQFARLVAALTDEVTADVPGLIHDAWVGQVVDIVRYATPTVQAFSRIPLPDSGMAVHVPVVRNAPPLGQQITEKTQVASGKFSVTDASLPVNTYAGGQDVSLQTLMRSDPSYMQVLMAAWTAELAGQMEQFAATTAAGGATAGGTWGATADTMADAFVDVAATMLPAIGRLPEVAVLAPDVWAGMAKAKDSTGRALYPAVAPSNPTGSADVTTPQGSVQGLTYYVSSQLPAGTALVGIREAFVTLIGNPIVLGPVDNVALAGRDVGVALFAACGVTDARGLYKITGSVPATAAATGSSRSTK